MANVKVLTPEGRFHWLHVFEATDNFKGTAKEKSLTLLIPKSANVSDLEKARDAAAKEEFNGKIPGPLRKIIGGQKPVLKDGDEYYETRDDDKKDMYEMYRGHWVLNVTCPEAQALRVLGPDGGDIYDPADLYNGCYGRVVINLSAYTAKTRPDFPGGPMLSVKLLGLRKTRDGELFETEGSGTTLTDDEVEKFFGIQSAASGSMDDM